MKPDFNKYSEVGGGSTVDVYFPAKGQEFELGEGVEGRYIEKKTGVGKHKSNVYVLESNGKKIGVLGSTVLDSKFENIAIGKMVAIAYAGEKEGKNGMYHDFKMGVGIDTVGDESGEPNLELNEPTNVPF